MATPVGKLGDGDMDMLEGWINTGPKTFTLLYSATRDGCSATTFHQKCDNQGATVTVLYNPQGSVYGGYTGQSWNSNTGTYTKDQTAFIFQLNFSGKGQRTKFPVVSSNYAIYSENTVGPTFGSCHTIHTFTNTVNVSNGVFALNGSVSFNGSYQMSNVSPKVKSWNDIHNGKLNVTELEVYKVTGKMIGKTIVLIKFKLFVSVYTFYFP